MGVKVFLFVIILIMTVSFILPFTGGLIAPGQGLFPKYFDGLYQYRTTSMIVSRGIGNSIFPFRVNNQPVIVVAELSSLEES